MTTVSTAADVPKTPEPPLPMGTHALSRWRHTRLRRRMLEGTWDDDLREIVNQAAGTKRAEAWKMVDLSANIFRSSMQQVSVQYDRSPFVLHAEPAGQAVADAMSEAGYWRLMPRVQRETLGCREMFVRVDLFDGVPVYRPAHADHVTAESLPRDPEQPAFLREAILRDRRVQTKSRKGVVSERVEEAWTWEEWDVSDPLRPRVQVLDERGNDCSPEFLRRADGSPAPSGGLFGADFTWRYDDDRPFLPYTLHHASSTGQLFDPYEARELISGSLNIALMWSFWGHIVRNAAWAQRYGINVRPRGAIARGEGEDIRQVVEMDPAMIALFEFDGDPDDPGKQVTLGQFAQAADPMVVAEAIALYERRVAGFAGISPADVQRVAGDPRSGFALAISREGQREAQVRFEPQFRVGDTRMLRLTAALLGRTRGGRFPLTGYDLRYQTLPLTVDERAALRQQTLELFDKGLISKVGAYQTFHPGVSEVDAVDALEKISRTNETVGVTRNSQAMQAEGLTLAALVEKAQSKAIPRDAAIAIVTRTFGVEAAAAAELLGSAGLELAANAAPLIVAAVGGPTAAVTEKVADTAMNGAQIASAKGIVLDYVAGLLSRESAFAMLQSFLQLSPTAAADALGPDGFVPAAPAPKPAPFPTAPPE